MESLLESFHYCKGSIQLLVNNLDFHKLTRILVLGMQVCDISSRILVPRIQPHILAWELDNELRNEVACKLLRILGSQTFHNLCLGI